MARVFARWMQRFIDVTAAVVGLILFSPLLLAIAVVLRCSGERRVLFTQERLGQLERPFRLFKFATMKVTAVDTGTVTRSDDPSVPAIGRVLRRTKLNELPQLWNILRGDISLVGPRPLPSVSFQFYPADVRPVVASMKPGLTGIGSLFFHDEEWMPTVLGKDDHACYLEDIMPLKGSLEVWYARHRSAWIDTKIVVASCVVAVVPRARFFVSWFPVESLLRDSSLHGYFMNSF